MKKSAGICLALGFLTLASSRAGAVPLLEIVTSSNPTWATTYPLPLAGSHDVAVTQGQIGWYAGNLRALENVELTFTYLGKEAGWTNALYSGGSQVFNTATSSPGQTGTGSATAGSWVDFVLAVLSGGNAGLSVTNGSNVAPIGVLGNGAYGAPNFWLGYVNGSQNSVYVAFDDGGGFWNGRIDDDNHDDLVFQITAVSVPEPAALTMFGAGLLIVGIGARRRRQLRGEA